MHERLMHGQTQADLAPQPLGMLVASYKQWHHIDTMHASAIHTPVSYSITMGVWRDVDRYRVGAIDVAMD